MTIKERNELVLNYLPLARSLASKAKKNLPQSVAIDELRSVAYLGLIDAAIKYAEEKSLFSTYARFRIYGELKDFVRDFYRDRNRMVVSDQIEITANDMSYDFEYLCQYLSDVDKKILTMYYINEMHMKEIGIKIGLSEGRVSQRLKSIREYLKKKLQD